MSEGSVFTNCTICTRQIMQMEVTSYELNILLHAYVIILTPQTLDGANNFLPRLHGFSNFTCNTVDSLQPGAHLGLSCSNWRMWQLASTKLFFLLGCNWQTKSEVYLYTQAQSTILWPDTSCSGAHGTSNSVHTNCSCIKLEVSIQIFTYDLVPISKYFDPNDQLRTGQNYSTSSVGPQYIRRLTSTVCYMYMSWLFQVLTFLTYNSSMPLLP